MFCSPTKFIDCTYTNTRFYRWADVVEIMLTKALKVDFSRQHSKIYDIKETSLNINGVESRRRSRSLRRMYFVIITYKTTLLKEISPSLFIVEWRAKTESEKSMKLPSYTNKRRVRSFEACSRELHLVRDIQTIHKKSKYTYVRV